jgi:hypothetical protein
MTIKPIVADRLKSYIAGFEEPDIIKALEKTGREVTSFENYIDNPILKDIYYVSSYPYNRKVICVFIGYCDSKWYITEGNL